MRSLALLAIVAVATAQIIPGEWLVVLKPNVAVEKNARMELYWKVRGMLKNGEPLFEPVHIEGSTYSVFGINAEDEEIEMVKSIEGVDYVAPNAYVYTAQGTCTSSPGTAWGVRRVTQWERGTDASNQFGAREATGQGAIVYILDTGVRLTHQSFTGRARFGANFVGGGNGDVHGHGTHCAGTAVGTGFGLAHGAEVYNVKVLSDQGSGSWAGIAQGCAWASNHARNNGGKGVLSLSLGGGGNQAADDAVRAAHAAGAVVVCASGNSNGNACNFSPARACSISVASSADNDARSSFSNFGTCTHIFAPGTNILSAGQQSDTATRTMSGTSMACPHVAGLAAKYWAANPSENAQGVVRGLTADWSNPNRITNPGAGSPNRLAYFPCNTGKVVSFNATATL
jgi:subtilisin family serine protease